MWKFWQRKPKQAPAQPVQQSEKQKQPSGFFSTDIAMARRNVGDWIIANAFQKKPGDFVAVNKDGTVATMDSLEGFDTIKGAFSLGQSGIIPQNLFAWYVSQGFIGYQACAIIAQHWLVDKACTQAPQDAVRKGYDITVNSGEDVPEEALAKLRELDQKHDMPRQLVQFAKFNRVFGIRVALFHVESDDPEYYEKPFNLDGVKPGSYRGISQVDPYWCTPELDATAAANTASKHFYEPTFWRINGQRYHRSHLVVIRGSEVPDVLKPSYIYGGLPLSQKIYERVYAAERVANEAPLLALTKRTTIMKVDTDAALADQAAFEKKLANWIYYRDNHGVKVLGTDEEMESQETSLADLDAVIMTEYQLVAAIANTPATKLIGTPPKGFNATGEYDEANYHEYLETIQATEFAPLLQRHHDLCIRSELAEKFGVFQTEIQWRPLDSMTETELADIRLKNAQADQVLQTTGAIDGQDIRKRVVGDKLSGYNGLETYEPELPVDLDDDLDPEADPDGEELPDATQPDSAVVPLSGDSSAAPLAAITNLTGKQFQNIERILRKVGNGTMTKAQGVLMLQHATGMTAEQAATFLDAAESQDDLGE